MWGYDTGFLGRLQLDDVVFVGAGVGFGADVVGVEVLFVQNWWSSGVWA
ncbi:hypothetical protein [Rappaport israeli]|nr:hypothetical protein [Rappaport israeli]